MESQTNMLMDQLENAEQQAEAMDESFKALITCMKIAMAIMHGDKVPAKDEQYLMENNPDLYKAAKAGQMMNRDEDSKEVDSALEEDTKTPTEQMADSLSSETPNLEEVVETSTQGD